MGQRLVILKIDNMNLQENINRIQQMMGIINEDSSTKEMIFDIINEAVQGADLYEHEGSLWLIFTDDKEWVIKLNKEGSLLYNYDFFNSVFKYLSLDVDENQHYIIEWVEDTIKNGIKYTVGSGANMKFFVEDTIKNGVKYFTYSSLLFMKPVENTVKKGKKIGKIKNR
jgi:hypothetical protein